MFERSLDPVDVDISDETFILTRETALAYREAQAKPVATDVPDVTQDHPSTDSRTEETTTPGSQPKETSAKASPPSAGGRALVWNGEIPAQKWMTFYTRVLSKFATGGGLRLTVKVEVAPEGGVSEQKVEETRSALRELGLDDLIDQNA